jgi:hypothetical protein
MSSLPSLHATGNQVCSDLTYSLHLHSLGILLALYCRICFAILLSVILSVRYTILFHVHLLYSTDCIFGYFPIFSFLMWFSVVQRLNVLKCAYLFSTDFILLRYLALNAALKSCIGLFKKQNMFSYFQE